MCEKTDEFPSYLGNEKFEKFAKKLFMKKQKLYSVRTVIFNKTRLLEELQEEISSLLTEESKEINILNDLFDAWKNS